jgi:hypothetical protein
MNTGNPHAISGNVAPLLLRLTHSGGEARNATMLIPPAGAGMADALQLCGERQSDAQWRVANLCRIAWRGEAGGWQLLNGSYTLVCAHNGARIPVGAAVTVAAGDALELGLLRFVLESGEGVVPEQMHVESRTSEDRLDVFDHWATASPAPAGIPHGFDLRDLDGRGSELRIDPFADPFGVLDIAGAKSRPAADTLAGLLGEKPRREARPAPAARPPAPPGPAESVLDELHEEFVRVVQDPGQLAGRIDWEGFVVFGGETAPTLDELSRQAEPYALLRDILLPREGIDQIIDEFEPLARSGLLEAEPSEDVLGLFAPELVREARTSLPSLTRREHHDLSPDSHVRIGSRRVGGEEGEKEGAS